MSLELMLLPHNGLVVVDVDKRAYLVERKSSGTFHFIQPAGEEHPAVHEGKVAVGDLACICPGGIFHGTCWATDAAKEFEQSIEEEARWGDLPWRDEAKATPLMADEPAADVRNADQPIPESATPAEPVPA